MLFQTSQDLIAIAMGALERVGQLQLVSRTFDMPFVAAAAAPELLSPQAESRLTPANKTAQ